MGDPYACPECGEMTTRTKAYGRGNPTNISRFYMSGVARCPSCLWTERDPDEQNSLTYEVDPAEGLDEMLLDINLELVSL